ncbi:hypothetical protein [Pendulispora rubella]
MLHDSNRRSAMNGRLFLWFAFAAPLWTACAADTSSREDDSMGNSPAALDLAENAAAAPCTDSANRVVRVSTAAQLKQALTDAKAGDRIELADGTYSGRFAATASGTSSAPIRLCGSAKAILNGGSPGSGYGFSLKGSYWVLSGFSVTQSQKGIMLDSANHNLLTNLEVYDTGMEAIHFRTHSSDNVLRDSRVRNTGKSNAGFGEGVYIGTAKSNWGSQTGGKPDKSDRNQVINNRIGPGVTAESIDIKEGTTGGRIEGNTFDGNGMTGENYADSWIDVKGNGYLLKNNTGSDALLDGFQLHQAVDGWGNDNVFQGNKISGVPNYGIFAVSAVTGTVVRCDNTISGGKGLSNITCTP